MTRHEDEYSDNVIRVIDRIEGQSDKSGVFEAVHGFGASFGFQFTTIGQLVHPSLRNIDYADLGASNFPQDFQDQYIAENYLLHDPVINRALVSMSAFAWSETYKDADRRGRSILEAGRAFDMREGVTVPIHIDDRAPGMVSFAGNNEGVSENDIKAFELVGLHAYSKLLDFVGRDRTAVTVMLTPRERDVVHYVANGLMDGEIATELGLGVHSVKKHLISVRRKLGAANRAHCVMIAIRDGHILL